MPRVTQAEYQARLAAPWLRFTTGEFWLRAIGARKDELEDTLRSANQARFPTYADAAAVERIAAERGGLFRYPSTTLESWRERLRTAFDVWRRAGTYQGVLNELLLSLGSQAGLDEWGFLLFTGNGQWAAITLAGVMSWFLRLQQVGNIYWLDRYWRTHWNVFTVFIRTSASNPSASFPDGSTLSDLARRVTKTWKSGHSRCARFILVGKDTLVWGGHHFENETLSTSTLLKWGDAGMKWRSNSSPSKSVVWQPPEGQ